jgi:3-oxoacyl-(acyl-carrier-protein) synthase
VNNNFAFGGHNASLVVQPRDFPNRSSRRSGDSDEIFITGIGVITPAGVGIDSLLGAVTENRSCILRGAPPSDLPARVPVFRERDIDRRLDFRNMDNAGRYAAAAAKLALRAGRYPDRPKNLSELGFYMAQSSAPVWAEEEHITGVLSHDYHVDRVHAFPYVVPNSVAGNVHRALSIQGHNAVFCGGPGVGNVGLGLAASAIRAGHADSIVCATSDELSSREVEDMISAGLISRGMPDVPAEGAAALLLERGSRLDSRSVPPLARVCGTAFGTESAADSKTRTDSLVALIETCLKRAGISPSDVEVLCFREHNDIESTAVRNLFNLPNTNHIDVSGLIGVAEASYPLLNLSNALCGSSIAAMFENYYILSIFASRYGTMNALICRKMTANELYL